MSFYGRARWSKLPFVAVISLFATVVLPKASAQVPAPPDTRLTKHTAYPNNVYNGEVVIAQLDGADYLDLVMTGFLEVPQFGSPPPPADTRFFTHLTMPNEPRVFDTTRVYVYNSTPQVPQVVNSALAVGDHDNDGSPDIAVAGVSHVDGLEILISHLVERSDAGDFVSRNPGWQGVRKGSLAWGDFDNDGRSDLLLTGATHEGLVTRLYANQGGGVYQDANANLPNIGFGEAVWGDSDNDGDLDILISGSTDNGAFESSVYLNDAGSFSDAGVELPGLAFGHARWVDLTGDGLLDIILAGARQSPFILENDFVVYENRGNNVYEQVPTEISGHFDGDLELIDWNADGDMDIVTSGFLNAFGNRVARIYTFEDGTFTNWYTFIHTIDMIYAVGDYDRDGDADLFATGYNPEPLGLATPSASYISFVGHPRNNAPTAPMGLTSVVTGPDVSLTWLPSTDDVTEPASLTYNLRVGSSPGSVDVVSPLADSDDGHRFVCEQGNVFHNRAWTVKDLPPGTYYWSVQAIDQSCQGSPFSVEGSFTVVGIETSNEDTPSEPKTKLGPIHPNPVVAEGSIPFSLDRARSVDLVVYDVLGRSVRRLVSGMRSAGNHTVAWDGRDDDGNEVAAGLYIYRLESEGTVLSGSMVLIR